MPLGNERLDPSNLASEYEQIGNDVERTEECLSSKPAITRYDHLTSNIFSWAVALVNDSLVARQDWSQKVTYIDAELLDVLGWSGRVGGSRVSQGYGLGCVSQ